MFTLHFCSAFVIQVCQSNVKLVTDENKYIDSFVVCMISDCKLFLKYFSIPFDQKCTVHHRPGVRLDNRQAG